MILSKLYNWYLSLKKQDNETIYLFKSGIFFIALDEDAYNLSKIFNFKLGKLNDTIVKCGFPCSSFNKYSNLFKLHNLKTKFIEKDNTIYDIKEYEQNKDISELLKMIESIDVENLSVVQAYKSIENLKNKVEIIKNTDNII